MEISSTSNWERIRERLIAEAEAKELIDVAVERHDSPFGPLLVAATDRGLVRLGLPGQPEEDLLGDLASRVSPRVLYAPRPSIAAARRQLDEYFDHERRTFALALDWRLTGGFRRDVLRVTARIPYGETGTYSSVAAAAGNGAAARAAGTALATNPVPIVVPCHRVLRSDGGLGQYLGGTEMKARLLELEGAL